MLFRSHSVLVQSRLTFGLVNYSNKVGTRMTGLMLLIVIGSIFAALGLAAMRWGVDTRDSAVTIR